MTSPGKKQWISILFDFLIPAWSSWTWLGILRPPRGALFIDHRNTLFWVSKKKHEADPILYWGFYISIPIRLSSNIGYQEFQIGVEQALISEDDHGAVEHLRERNRVGDYCMLRKGLWRHPYSPSPKTSVASKWDPENDPLASGKKNVINQP